MRPAISLPLDREDAGVAAGAEEAHFVVAERLDIDGAESVLAIRARQGSESDGAGASVGRGRCGG
jgi:hypothetical protein